MDSNKLNDNHAHPLMPQPFTEYSKPAQPDALDAGFKAFRLAHADNTKPKSNTSEASDKAMRANSNKVQMSHVLDFPRAMALLAQVASQGAEKYQRGNFQRGQYASVTLDSLMRHLFKWWAGEDDDPESGNSHLGHVMWNAIVLAEDMQRGIKEQDDRTFNDSTIAPLSGDTFEL